MQALIYRLLRLRRLILVTVLPPLFVVTLIWVVKGSAALALYPLALLLPVAHILRFPSAWMESVALSLSLSVLLALAGTMGADLGVVGLALRILGLAVLGAVLMLALIPTVAILASRGAPRPITHRSKRHSKLDPETLRAAVTLYPGRSDDRYECGEVNGDGIFPITLKLAGPPPLCPPDDASVPAEDLDPEAVEAAKAEMAEQMAELNAQLEAEGLPPLDYEMEVGVETGPDLSGAFEVQIYGVVSHSDAHVHDVITVEEGSAETTVTRMGFTPTRTGTLVSLEERGAPMPPGYLLGFWLQDYGADFLADEIQRAEGRVPRTVRSANQDDMLTHVAGWLAARFAGSTPAE